MLDGLYLQQVHFQKVSTKNSSSAQFFYLSPHQVITFKLSKNYRGCCEVFSKERKIPLKL